MIGDDDLLEFVFSKTSENSFNNNEVNVTRRVASHLMPLVSKLREGKVSFEQVIRPLPKKESKPLQSFLVVLLPMAYVGLMGYFMYRFMGKARKNVLI